MRVRRCIRSDRDGFIVTTAHHPMQQEQGVGGSCAMLFVETGKHGLPLDGRHGEGGFGASHLWCEERQRGTRVVLVKDVDIEVGRHCVHNRRARPFARVCGVLVQRRRVCLLVGVLVDGWMCSAGLVRATRLPGQVGEFACRWWRLSGVVCGQRRVWAGSGAQRVLRWHAVVGVQAGVSGAGAALLWAGLLGGCSSRRVRSGRVRHPASRVEGGVGYLP